MPTIARCLVLAVLAATARAALFDIERATALEAKYARATATFNEALQNVSHTLDRHWTDYHRARKRNDEGIRLSKEEMKTVRAVRDGLLAIRQLQTTHLKTTRQIADEHAAALERAERDGELVLVAAARSAFQTKRETLDKESTVAFERAKEGTVPPKDEL
jgi:hypothetical protein